MTWNIYVSEALARAYNLHVHFFSVGTFGGLAPPPPNTKKLATLLLPNFFFFRAIDMIGNKVKKAMPHKQTVLVIIWRSIWALISHELRIVLSWERIWFKWKLLQFVCLFVCLFWSFKSLEKPPSYHPGNWNRYIHPYRYTCRNSFQISKSLRYCTGCMRKSLRWTKNASWI